MLVADFRRALAQHPGAEAAWDDGMRRTEHPERWLNALNAAAETHTLPDIATLCAKHLGHVYDRSALMLFRLERAAGINDQKDGD